jgi:trehalose-phosphatase
MAKGISPAWRFAAATDGPVALFLDVDGTLLDLAERPDEVVMPAGLLATLAEAEHKVEGALALVSGRAIDDLDRLFEPLRLRASGVHGAQMRFDPSEPAAQSQGAVELPASLWAALTRAVGEFPGAFAENKRFSFAVHYRLAQGLEKSLRETVMRLIDSQPQTAIEVVNAHYAFELKVPGRQRKSDRDISLLSAVSRPDANFRRRRRDGRSWFCRCLHARGLCFFRRPAASARV